MNRYCSVAQGSGTLVGQCLWHPSLPSDTPVFSITSIMDLKLESSLLRALDQCRNGGWVKGKVALLRKSAILGEGELIFLKTNCPLPFRVARTFEGEFQRCIQWRGGPDAERAQ